MSTSNTTINKKNKKHQYENDINKDRNSNKRSASISSSKTPLFEQFNAIVENEKQQHTQFSKKQSQMKRVSGASVQPCDSESSQMTNKKQKPTQPSHNILGEQPNYDSGSSYDDEGYDQIQNQSYNPNPKQSEETANEIDQSGSEEDSENEGEFKDAVDTSSVDTSFNQKNDTNQKNGTNKKTCVHNSVLSPQLTTSLQWYVRNTLFKKVKIIDETLLEASGYIIQEALDTIKIDKSSNHIHAYINDCRRIIKRAMCSRRGYVKHEISVKLKSKYCTKQFILYMCDCKQTYKFITSFAPRQFNIF